MVYYKIFYVSAWVITGSMQNKPYITGKHEEEFIMALDGITIAAVADELDQVLTGGRIAKIAQPEIGRAHV